jgi:hypothetical protein
MTRNRVLYTLRIAVVTGIFGAGYLCGSLTQHTANAQLGDIGGDVMKRASESGGTLGSVAKLGTTISDLEKHVSGLQKNIDTLKSVKSALGGVMK